MTKAVLTLAALNGLLAVAVGAFGAHGIADPEAKAWIATGASYGLGHAAAAFATIDRSRAAAWAMTLGALIFGGALYTLGLGGPRFMGAVAPVGGVLMIVGWAALIHAALRRASA